MFNGKISFVIEGAPACMGVVHQVMICSTFENENKESRCKRYPRLIRNTSRGENNDGRYEVEQIIIDQGCNQRFAIHY
ncbi:MAG: hypothetical protein P8Y08_11300 [Desulfobulbaceae bacterium]